MSYEVLESVQVGASTVEFYVDYGSDSAVLGFAVHDDAGHGRYFPMYGSTYRGLPPVTLDVYATDSGEEMWVRTTWTGYEVLAYHRMGSDRSITRYGEMTSSETPTPTRLSGVTREIPEMDEERASRVASITRDPNDS